MDENEARKLYEKMLTERGVKFDGMTKAQTPADLLYEYKKVTNLSIRKMAAITGLNKDILCRLLRNIH